MKSAKERLDASTVSKKAAEKQSSASRRLNRWPVPSVRHFSTMFRTLSPTIETDSNGSRLSNLG